GACSDSAESGKTATATPAPAATVTQTPPVAVTQPEPVPSSTATANSAAGKGEQVYNMTCKTCHKDGIAGAPKLGDKGLWGPRIAKGMDALMKSALDGVPGTAMPPRGTCMTCSDEDLKVAVDYMVAKSQ
ncbi:MAG: cytochrome c5 family protein, partial [Gammaproteobacteria bacterium]|nr:cytochrome c5 family protein [Gammaproteobacteria bacterium]